MIAVNVLHRLREIIPDEKTGDESLLYDDSFYEETIRLRGHNPDAPYSSLSEEQYMQLKLDVWYNLAGDLQKVRKMEEIGVVKDTFPAQEHIRMLEFKLSRFKKEVYGELSIP